MKPIVSFFILLLLFACKSRQEQIKPVVKPISESIYASGVIKSNHQYEAFATVNGIIEQCFVEEGDTVKKGQPLLSVSNEAQRLSKENAELTAAFYNANAYQGQLEDAHAAIELARNKMVNDSMLLGRQQNLWKQNIGTKTELEQRQLAYENSRTIYQSSITRYNDLKRQVRFASEQSRKNLLISQTMARDYMVRSEINGIVYSLTKEKGEIINPQTVLAVIGDANLFLLEMQIDEYDILQIKTGQLVLVSMDSYKSEIFEARVTKVYPYMNERSKTFLVEAVFSKQPPVLYPNLSFEANIVIQTKQQALLVPRKYVLNDSVVVKSNGERVVVKTGLRDYQNIEILSGISANDDLILPAE